MIFNRKQEELRPFFEPFHFVNKDWWLKIGTIAEIVLDVYYKAHPEIQLEHEIRDLRRQIAEREEAEQKRQQVKEQKERKEKYIKELKGEKAVLQGTLLGKQLKLVAANKDKVAVGRTLATLRYAKGVVSGWWGERSCGGTC